MLRSAVLSVLLVFALSAVGEENFDEANDAELENLKRAERHKRAAVDAAVLVKCSEVLMNKEGDEDEDSMTAEEKAALERQLGLCLAQEALKKEMAGKDSAANMLKRIQNLDDGNVDAVGMYRRGWLKKAVKKVSGWIKKHKKTIVKGGKIAGHIIKAIWGKK